MRLIKTFAPFELEMREKMNDLRCTFNEHLQTSKQEQPFVIVFSHLNCSQPLPHSIACNKGTSKKLQTLELLDLCLMVHWWVLVQCGCSIAITIAQTSRSPHKGGRLCPMLCRYQKWQQLLMVIRMVL
jgi:hypothetical protein